MNTILKATIPFTASTADRERFLEQLSKLGSESVSIVAIVGDTYDVETLEQRRPFRSRFRRRRH